LKTSVNISYSLLQSLSTFLFQLITFIYASKILGPDGIGVSSFAESICRYFMLIAALGIPIYGLREISKVSDSRVKRSKLFLEILILNIITSLIVVIPYLILIFNNEKFVNYNEIYLLGVFYIFINAFSIDWFYQGLSEFKYLSIRTILVRFCALIFLFLFVKTKNDVFWFFLLSVLILFINNSLDLLFLKNKIILDCYRLEIKKHLKPLFIIFISTIAISLYVLFDVIILGFLKDDYFVGLYSFASKINKVPVSLVLSVCVVFLPKLVFSYTNKNYEEFNHLANNSLQFIISFSIPIGLIILTTSNPIILLLSDQSFLDSAWSLRLLTPITLLIGLSYFFGMQVLLTVGQEKKIVYSVLAGTIISLVLNFSLVPILAEKGTAIANLISETTVVIISGYFASKYIDLSNIFKLLISHTLSYLLLTFILLYINFNGFSTLIIILINGFLFLINFMVTNIFILKTPYIIKFFKTLKIKN